MDKIVAAPAAAGFQYWLFKGFALACLAVGVGMTASASAQEDDSQPQQPTRWRPKTTARQYPDDELPGSPVATSYDAPAEAPPLPTQIDSPSNQPATRRKSATVAAAADDSTAPETIPAPHMTHSHAPSPQLAEEGPVQQGNIFGECNEGDQCDQCDFGCCAPSMHDRIFFRGEALLWWLKGEQTPPLLTTSPASTPLAQAGVLGQPNTSIIFGDQEMNPGLHAGAKLTFGTWLGCGEESGLEFSYMILGQNTQSYGNSSTGIPILARPFFNITTGAEDSNVIAYPNASGGTFSASSTENFEGAEALWRRAIVCGPDGRIDMLLGYRFNRLTDGLFISDSVTASGSATIAPAGTTVNVADSFHTQNDFNGADLGFSTEWRRGRWTLDTLLKMGVGDTHSQVLINGATAIIASGTTTNYHGGLLALPSNMGYHDSEQFSMMPEIGFTLGYAVTPKLTASLGYTLLYWSNVARPGDQIDLNVDTNQLPPPIAIGVKPAYELHTSDFWAQGVSLAMNYTF